MKKNPSRLPAPEMTLPISLEHYQKLLGASCRCGYKMEIWEIGAEAIHDWLARNDPEAFGAPIIRGYQWKELFLPNGTLLRTNFEGKTYYSLVEEDELRHNGKPTSPSQFANSVGGVRRNAWKVTWILFPNTTVWKQAGTLRKHKNTRNLTNGSNRRHS